MFPFDIQSSKCLKCSNLTIISGPRFGSRGISINIYYVFVIVYQPVNGFTRPKVFTTRKMVGKTGLEPALHKEKASKTFAATVTPLAQIKEQQ